MSRLDFVRGIKVSAPRKVLGNYTKAAAGFRERGEFGIYVGNAHLDLRPVSAAHGRLGCGFGALESLPTAWITPDRGGLRPLRMRCLENGREPGRCVAPVIGKECRRCAKW